MGKSRGNASWSRRDVLKGTGLATAAVLAAPVMAACAAPSAGGPPASTKETPKPIKGGHVTEGLITNFTDISPIRNASSGISGKIFSTLYMSLVALGPDGGLVPRLATAVPKISADGLSYTFELRKDMKWSDGKPVTADDVLFTYKLMYHPDYKAVQSPFRTDLEAVLADVQAPDPYTFVLKTKTQRAGFLTVHATYFVLPKHVLGDVPAAQLNTHDYMKAPKVVCGPFKFGEWITDDHITVVRNEAYGGPAPYIDRFIIKFADQNSVITQLKTGEADLFTSNTFSRFEELATTPNLELTRLPSGSGPRFWYNLDPAAPASRIFQSKAVRQALRYAADVEGYGKAVLFNTGRFPSSIGVFPPQSWANDPNGKPAYSLDKKKAEELLEADGWKRGASGVRAKNGLALKFDILTSGNSQEWQQGAAIFQQNWKDIGAAVSILAPPFAQQTVLLLKHEYDIAMQSSPYSGQVDPDPALGFHSRYAAPGGRNYGGYKNPQVDQLIDQAATTLDQAKRKELYTQLQAILNEDIPSFGTPFTSTGWTHTKRVMGVGPDVVGPYNSGMRWYLDRVWVTDGK